MRDLTVYLANTPPLPGPRLDVDTLVIVGEFLSWSVDAGFVLALPLHHGDLEFDSLGVLTKDHVAILVAWPWFGGPICEIKYLCKNFN